MSFLGREDGPPCPRCEANGTHLERETETGKRYRCEYCDHVWQVRPAATERTIAYRPVRCPVCGSKDCPVHTTRLPLRYHKCRVCWTRFRSREV